MQGYFDAALFGAKPSASEDQTSNLQQALDAAGVAGGVVELCAGEYLVAGSLHIPPGVCLRGVNQAPQYSNMLKGSVILATGGRDNESGPALLELGDSSSAKGFAVYYPEQKIEEVHPYSWTFHLYGFDTTLENITLVNSYNAIQCGPESNGRHVLRYVYGTALRRGLLVDNCSDIGRVENVHWHCHWWASLLKRSGDDPVFAYMGDHLEAFIFARTDWEYVTNTFVFPCNIGYHFIKTLIPNLQGHDSANGSLLGIGADLARIAIQVDRVQFHGVAITNGEFAAFLGDHPTGLLVGPDCLGAVRLENCSFFGSFAQIVVSHGQYITSVQNCLLQTFGDRYLEHPRIMADSGKLQVIGNSFALCGIPEGQTQVTEMVEKAPGVDVHIARGCQSAIIMGNTSTHGVHILNESGDSAVIANNESPKQTHQPSL
jgi:hypothetical protein